MINNKSATYNEAMAKLAEAQNYQKEIINCNNLSQEIIKARDTKLNEALAKALDLVDDEMDKGMFYINSLGSQVLGNIYGFMALYNIRIQYSIEFMAKFAKVTAKGLPQFPFDIRGFGW